MTKGEFDHWTEQTKFSENAWMLDPIRLHNQGDYLFYKGGVDGVYVWVEKNGLVDVGTYEGAVPHIGEAIFTPKHSRQLANNRNEAFALIAQRLNVPMFLSLAKEFL